MRKHERIPDIESDNDCEDKVVGATIEKGKEHWTSAEKGRRR